MAREPETYDVHDADTGIKVGRHREEDLPSPYERNIDIRPASGRGGVSGPRKASGVAFDPPSDSPMHHKMSGPIARHGLGAYYGALGMNKFESNKRHKARGVDKEEGAEINKHMTDFKKSRA